MLEDSFPAILFLVIPLIVVVLLFCILQIKLIRGKKKTEDITNQTLQSLAVLQERLVSRESQLTRLNARLDASKQELQLERKEVLHLREKVTRHETLRKEEHKQYQAQTVLLKGAREQMKLEFKSLANDILEKKSLDFSRSNEDNIQNILQPLKEKIQSFEKKVEDVYDKESKERFSLQNEIKNLQALNVQISSDAINLTNALKGENKTQGAWGEMILERILENAGLTNGREYELQVSLKSEDGKLRQPDVVINLPNNKSIIIDAKVSLKSYERYCSIPDESAEDKTVFLNSHIQSIKTHISSLSEKNYQNLLTIQSLDFIIMFLPVEQAYALAVQHKSSLFMEAFDKNIILASPSTLLATLRTIQNIWRNEQQNKNALEIAKRAGALYDKFAAFTEDLSEVGHRLDQTQASYDKAYGKLITGRGNLLSQAEKLKELGARASKKLPENLLNNADFENITSTRVSLDEK